MLLTMGSILNMQTWIITTSTILITTTAIMMETQLQVIMTDMALQLPVLQQPLETTRLAYQEQHQRQVLLGYC